MGKIGHNTKNICLFDSTLYPNAVIAKDIIGIFIYLDNSVKHILVCASYIQYYIPLLTALTLLPLTHRKRIPSLL